MCVCVCVCMCLVIVFRSVAIYDILYLDNHCMCVEEEEEGGKEEEEEEGNILVRLWRRLGNQI